jgi:four helix bundle protein
LPKHTELATWNLGIDLVERVYKLCRNLPKTEKYELVSQLKRASISVPSQIAEGAGRDSIRDYIRFLTISRGSLRELHTQLVICRRLKYLKREQLEDTLALQQRLAAKLTSQIKSLKKIDQQS